MVGPPDLLIKTPGLGAILVLLKTVRQVYNQCQTLNLREAIRYVMAKFYLEAVREAIRY